MDQVKKKKMEFLYLSGEREISLKKNEDLPNSDEKPEPISPLSVKKEQKPVENEPQTQLEQLKNEIGDCTRCRLSEARTHVVFGVGSPKAQLMFVGEGPGRDEDLQAEPFVGRAGKLLTKMIEAMGLNRSKVYIANVVKCRPPQNRNPAPDEIATCEPFLLRQIEVIAPKVIVCLGTFAAQTLLQTEAKITQLRGNFQTWPSARVKNSFETSLKEASIQVMPTYHPAFLLRNPNMKRPVWEDLQQVMEKISS